MFGEVKIVGETIVKINANGKMKLPAFTGAEVGEKIMSMIYFNKSKIILSKEEELIEKLQLVIEKTLELHKNDPNPLQLKRQLERNVFARLCFMPETVDKDGKILIPKKALETVGISNTAYIVGNETNIHIYPSEESYKLTLKNN